MGTTITELSPMELWSTQLHPQIKSELEKVSLDGTNDYVNLSSHVGSFSSFSQGTIAAWVYADSATQSIIFSATDSGDTNSVFSLHAPMTGL